MKELLRINDITVIAYAKRLLSGSGIDVFELDVNMGVMEAGIGILPRRLIGLESDLASAKFLMYNNEISLN